MSTSKGFEFQEWRFGLVVMALVASNEVTLHPAQLVLRQVTICVYDVVARNQLLRPTQPPALSGMENEYQPRGSDSALWLERKP